MNRHWADINRIILALAILIATCSTAIAAFTDPYSEWDECECFDMEWQQNIEHPAVDHSEHHAISRHMTRLANTLAAKNLTVDLFRNDEVIIVTYPTDNLFNPNDTLLTRRGQDILKPLFQHLADPDMLKLVYVVHTDNTGSTEYNGRLSEHRGRAIYEWFRKNLPDDLFIIPYFYGDLDPIESNNTWAGRRANRRLEIFLIPGPKMITKAHKGTLK